MDSIGKTGINYPEDFKVACAIHAFTEEDVLQYFINRVSFYAYNGGEMEAVALIATNIIIDCRIAYRAEILPVADRRVRRTVIKYIRLLSTLSTKPGLSLIDKIQQSFLLMEEWEMAMAPFVHYPKRLHLDNEHSLVLTFDFCLLCHINGVEADQLLQYFIDHISLPAQRARGIAESDDPVMSLFTIMLMNRSIKPVKIPAHEDIHNWYVQELQKLDKQMTAEQDRKSKQRAYRKLYGEWYNSLKHDIH